MSAPGSPPWSKAAAPIWAYVSGYAPRSRAGVPLAFLQAFTDDSASETGDRRLFMAGYLNHAEKWARFAEAWDEELRAAPAIDHLHMVEAYNLRGQFDFRRGWTAERRDGKLRDLSRVIRHFEPLSFEFSINREKFYRDLKPVSPRGMQSPHFTLCFFVVAGLANFAASQNGNIPIDFIFDAQDGVSGDVVMFFEDMIRVLPKKSKRLINGTPIFRSDLQFTQLQAADMLAWYLRRQHETGEKMPITNLVLGNNHLAAEVPEGAIDKWAAHHSQLPGLKMVQSKAQWRGIKEEIARLKAAGIDPRKVNKPGIYYPVGTPFLFKMFDKIRRLFARA